MAATNVTSGSVALPDILILATAAVLPWTWGGFEMWSVRAAASLLVAAGAVALYREGWSGWGLGERRLRWLVPAILLAFWAAGQLVPLPPTVLGLLTPATEKIYRRNLPNYAEPTTGSALSAIEQRLLGELDSVPQAQERPVDRVILAANPAECAPGWRPISLAPDLTLERVCWFLPLLLVFVLVRRSAEREATFSVYRRTTMAILAVSGLSFFFAEGYRAGLQPFLDFLGEFYFGLYGNPNHRAGLMELAIPWFVGHAWWIYRDSGRSAFSQARFAACVAAAIACIGGAIVSSSKAAIVLIAGSLLALAWLGVSGRRQRLAVVIGSMLVGATAVALLWSTDIGERIGSHLARLESFQIGGARPPAWAAATRMVVDFPITGVGFGAFREVFPAYLPAGENLRWLQAHNDYLEVLLDGGMIAGALLVWLIVAFVAQLARTGRRIRGRRDTSWLGMVLGLTAISIHAFVDFNHQMPATALLFVILGAMAIAYRPAPETHGVRP